jgi:hypothetical protein
LRLTLRRTWPDEPFPRDDWLVLDNGEKVGRVYEASGTAGTKWFWAINGGHASHAASSGIRASGLAPTFETAKATWREQYEQWLRLSGHSDSHPTGH